MPDLRLEREALLKCPQCGGTPYTLWRRQVKPESPVYENLLWPNSADVPPPARGDQVVCPTCGVACRRVAP